MINALSKILGRKKSGNNDHSSVSAPSAPPKTKETIWQKATSLRQSLRHSSRSKVAQKTGTLPDLSYLQSSSDTRKVSSIGQLKNSILRREWGSQRNLARERRSLAATPKHSNDHREGNLNKRSLHARSFCVSGDDVLSWDLDVLVKSVPEGIDRTSSSSYLDESAQPPGVVELPRHHQRSTRKLTKDSGYETSAQGDPDYINTLSDWLSEEKILDDEEQPKSRINSSNDQKHNANTKKKEFAKPLNPPSEKKLEWNSRHRPLSFSHQEVPAERKNRQLRHSYSQREVSTSQYQENPAPQHYFRQPQADSSRYSKINLKLESKYPSVESVSSNVSTQRHLAKSTPHLHHPLIVKRANASSISNLQSENVEELDEVDSMVTRRFKKGSVYDALASTSGLDFSPVVQLKTYHTRREDQSIDSSSSKPSSKKLWDDYTTKSTSSNDNSNNARENNVPSTAAADVPKCPPSDIESRKSSPKESKRSPKSSREDPSSCNGGGEASNCVTAHEKYPSWPVTNVSPNSSTTFRSHSWTGHTDYPKEKVGYLRPKKSFKITTNQLQPVLEKSQDSSIKKTPLPTEEFRPTTNETNILLNPSLSTSSAMSTTSNSNSVVNKSFDFEAFHTPCIPRCFGEKDYNIHSPPQRDISSGSPNSNEEIIANDSNSFLSRYEEVLRHQAQYSAPLTMWNKPGSDSLKDGMDTPFLDRLRLDNARAWPHPPPPPPPPPQLPLPTSPVLLVAAPQPPGNDIELSSENGTWMGSMESSSHGRGLPKWQGSYSDLSTLSTQLSNRSSLFDSGHSTMPESGRLSPQSSCGSTAPSLLLEGPTRAQVVARHGCHREIVAHSARVQQPERHGSESVLYYATGGLSRPKTALSFNVEDRPIKSPEPVPGPSGIRQTGRNNSLPEEPPPYVHCSQASLTLSQSNCCKNSDTTPCSSGKYSPKRESRNSNSFSSEDSNLRGKDGGGEDTSGSSSDVSNVTCISNYRDRMASKSWDSANTVGNFHQQNISQQNTHLNNKASKHGSFDSSGRVTNHGNPVMKQQFHPLSQKNVSIAANARETLASDYHTRNENDSDIQHRRKLDHSSAPRYKNEEQVVKSRSMDESSRKLLYPETEKRQRISEPDLKTIQKQAVFSFYQRMSLAESVKSSSGHDGPILKSPSDNDPPPPYEATSPTKLRMSIPKMSLLPNKYLPQGFDEGNKIDKSSESSSNSANKSSSKAEAHSGLLNVHSKSVPNLVALKGQSMDLAPPNHRFVPNIHQLSQQQQQQQSQHQQQQTFWANGPTPAQLSSKRGSPLAKEEIIPWDQLPSMLEKKREAAEKATPVAESKDPPEDGSSSSTSASNYFKGHKSPRKVQLKEVHHSNETASVKVITPDGVTLVQTSSTATSDHQSTKSKEEKTSGKDHHHHHHHHHQHQKNNNNNKVPHKRRPAPPPPPKQPPKRPPPPPPPESPEPTPAVVVVLDKDEPPGDIDKELQELRIDERHRPDVSGFRCPGHISSSSSSPQLLGNYGSSSEAECCSSPELPLPPPPPAGDNRQSIATDEPLPPPPESLDVELPNRTLDSTSLVYPKNSYMSYRSEKKLGRQGFDGNYRRSFHASSSSVDLTYLGNTFLDTKDMVSPSSWEQMHNIRQHGTTVIFHSDTLHSGSTSTNLEIPSSQDFSMNDEPEKHCNISVNNQIEPESGQDRRSSECAVPCAASQENINVMGSDFTRLNGNDPQCQHKLNEDVVINGSEPSELLCKENGISTDSDFGSSSMDGDSISVTSIDQNQNAVDNPHGDRTALVNNNNINNNNNELIIRTNSSTQTTNTPRLKRKHSKTKQELECERLSIDFVHRYGDIALKNLLVPAANHKTMSDYMEGLLNIELEKSGKTVGRVQTTEDLYMKQNGHWEENNKNNEVNEIQETKSKQQNHCMDILESHNLNSENELRKMREELMISIKKKVENLRNEQLFVREEIKKNEKLGKEITGKVQKLAKPNEVEKYVVHVEEMEKIMNLLLSLSGRLAKSVNMLECLPKDASPEEKRILIAKRDKLLEQHEDARRLKESIDRRSNQVSTFLHRYLSDEEFADYDYFIKTKTKLIVDIKEMDEKINLGEEQLAALRNSMDAPVWKSANS